ncbi:hypothetical protein GLAREA_04149 [Glarea lozoyensis ATCC 20868]|uniref:Uncharacterized protein n=1 Tax=Glarea lozoyensis (strain ATCC 20868 / MF5171) TaxID=1116229 RepID=S3CXW7_GLAL2|nr:uncharacterized protein GLAREA_04149 [Glarea lozoyensis ATCC 20868]EPE31182.1 hypothetical protein GLAREA_04149 [Glarea lozoyensis ATCC 20868]
MGLYKAIAECFGHSSTFDESNPAFTSTNEKAIPVITPTTEVQTAEALISAISVAEKLGRNLEITLQNIVEDNGFVHSNGLWYEGIAKILLGYFETLVREGQDAKFTGAVKEAFEKANDVVREFVDDHPILTAVVVTLVVLGLLMYAAPWAVRALGFTLQGPLEGE